MDIKKEKITYIDNNQLKGVKIDWLKARKYFIQLTKEIPNKYKGYNIPLERLDLFWHVLLSERSTGKTTTILLIGMIINKMYDRTMCYFRQFKDETTQKYYNELFNVIEKFGYIQIITDGIYNSVVIERNTKKVFYCKRDENGKITDKSEKPLMYILAIENSMSAKSTFNVPDASIILFDEFSSDRYLNGEISGWEHFHTWLSTITRDTRLDFKIFMLSNTLSPYNKYLEELGIHRILLKMKKGEHRIVDGGLGANVFVELIDADKDENISTQKLNRALMIHGFLNPKLKAIYGGTWEIRNYPHLPRIQLIREDDKNIFIESMGTLLNVEFWTNDTNIFINLSKSYRNVETTKDDAIILSDVYDTNSKRIYGINPLIQKIHNAYKHGLLYFSDNECGLLFDTFISNLK